MRSGAGEIWVTYTVDKTKQMPTPKSQVPHTRMSSVVAVANRGGMVVVMIHAGKRTRKSTAPTMCE